MKNHFPVHFPNLSHGSKPMDRIETNNKGEEEKEVPLLQIHKFPLSDKDIEIIVL